MTEEKGRAVTRWRLASFDGGVARFVADEAGPWVSVIDHLRALAAADTTIDKAWTRFEAALENPQPRPEDDIDLSESQATPIPAGFKLVPIEPTSEMRKAAADAWLDCGNKMVLNKAAAAIRAGIAAAPGALDHA